MLRWENMNHIFSFMKGWSCGFVICFILLFLLSVASIPVHDDHAIIHANITAGLRGILNSKTSTDNWTDCLILSGALAPNSNILEYIGSPLLIIENPCIGLDAAMRNINDAVWHSYERYWLGSIYLATIALGYCDVSVVQKIYKFAMVFSLFCLGFAGLKLKRDLRTPLLVVCLGVFLGSGINAFGGHLGHSPTYFLPIFALAIFIVFPFKKFTVNETAIFGAVIGTITGYFDMLSGGIPFTLALSIFIYYLLWANSPSHNQDLKGLFLRIMVLIFAYVLSIIMLVAIKLFVATALIGHTDAFETFMGQLIWRMSGDGTNADNRLAATGVLARKLWVNRGNVFIGGALGGSITYLLGGCAWIVTLSATWYNYKVSRNLADVLSFLMPFLAAMVVPLWFMVFTSHGYIHAWFMTRVVCLVPVFGVASACISLGNMRRNRTVTIRQ